MTGKIRIISGQWRGRRIPVSDHPELRPTGDRARETLFNWLGPKVIGSRCLDLFAGSGALGLEAASRGAVEVILLERDACLAGALRELLGQWPGSDGVRVEQADALQWLGTRQEPVDIVFADPPFGRGMQVGTLESLKTAPCCADQTLVYVESELDEEPDLAAAVDRDWVCLKHKRQGRIVLRLLKPANSGLNPGAI